MSSSPNLKERFQGTFPDTLGLGTFYVNETANQGLWFENDYTAIGCRAYFVWMQGEICMRNELRLDKISNDSNCGADIFTGPGRNIYVFLYSSSNIYPTVHISLSLSNSKRGADRFSYKFSSKVENEISGVNKAVETPSFNVALEPSEKTQGTSENEEQKALLDYFDEFYCGDSAFISPNRESGILDWEEKGDPIVLVHSSDGYGIRIYDTKKIEEISPKNEKDVPHCHPWICGSGEVLRVSHPTFNNKTDEATIYVKHFYDCVFEYQKYTLEKQPSYFDEEMLKVD